MKRLDGSRLAPHADRAHLKTSTFTDTRGRATTESVLTSRYGQYVVTIQTHQCDCPALQQEAVVTAFESYAQAYDSALTARIG